MNANKTHHAVWLLAVILGFISVIVALLVVISSNNRWGKRLDPVEFWKDRTIWCDKEAKAAARKHGRWYPPIPGDTNYYLSGSGGDIGLTTGGPDSGPFVTHYQNDRERYFWDNFSKTHPKPPEYLEWKQLEVASAVYNARYLFGKSSPDEIARMEEHAKRDLAFFNYPEEAFTDEALFWCRVMALRNPRGRMFVKKYTDIDAKLLNEPLTAEQIKAANAWKVSYLQRLRRENTDESYINAYLKAWNLKLADVFPETTNR